MQRLPARLVNGAALGTAAEVLYLTPGGTKTTISAMTVTNTSAAVASATVHLVPAGGAPDATNAVLWLRNLSPGESRIVDGAIAQTLHQGGTIQALASAGASINMVASGYETVA